MQESNVEFVDEKNMYFLKVNYGFTCFEGQDPYFSITGELRGSDGYRAFGCLHDDIQKHCKEVAPLVKWHLVSLVKGPMHYIDNAVFWWKRSLMTEPEYKGDTTAIGEKALENFKSTVVYGSTSLDFIGFRQREEISTEVLTTWLNLRFNEMMESFYEDMRRYKVIGVMEERG